MKPATITALRFARQHFLALLVVAYVCSVFFPHLGLLIRTPLFSGSEISSINFMLAAVLLTLGLSTPLDGLKQIAGNLRAVSLFYVVRITAALLVALATHFVVDSQIGNFVGLIMVCVAPTAASSASWSLQLGSCKTTTIALILGTTLLSLLIGPAILALTEVLATTKCTEDLTLLRQYFSAGFALPWVVLPTVAGMAWKSLLPATASKCRDVGLQLNPVLLLLLNYANAASSFPKIAETFSMEQSLICLAGTAALFAILAYASQRIGRKFTKSKEQLDSQMIGTAMSNSGLMLVMATLAMPDRLDVHLPIIVYTFIQHLGVARRSRLPSPEKPADHQAST